MLDSYYIDLGIFSVKVEIKEDKKKFVPVYKVKFPRLDEGTEAIYQEIRDRLISQIKVVSYEISERREELKKEFKEKAEKEIEKLLPGIDDQTRKYLVGRLVQEMLGLGKLEIVLADANLEEVVINSSQEPIQVYHKKYGWLETNLDLKSEEEIANYASIIGRSIRKQITNLNPLLDAHLPTGDRVNATLYPVSNEGNTITIRKFRKVPWTITEFIANNTVNVDVVALLWFAIQYELNILISGGTGTGKTSFLTTLMPFIPPNQRIISIEDSVSGEEEVLFKDKGKLKKMVIKDFFNNCSSDYIYPDSLEVLSVSKKGKTEFKRVKKVIRHWVNKPLYRIKLASGKEIKVTGDHSLYSLSEDLCLAPAKVKELKQGSFIATPRFTGLPGSLKSLDLFEIFKDSKVFFVGEGLRNFLNSRKGREFLIKEIETKLRSKRSVYRKKGMLPANLFKNLTEDVKKEGLFVLKGKTRLPLNFEISSEFAFLMGCWVGDGSYDRRSIIFSISDQEFLERIVNFCRDCGIELRKHSDGHSYMLNSTLIKELMEKLGLVGNSFTKRIPDFVFSLPKELKAEFLKGLFSAEGWVKKNEVALTTYSERLVRDLQTLLLNFGIVLRVGEYRDKNNKTYFETRISSSKFLEIFKNEIGFVQDYKMEKLEEIGDRKLHEISDRIPLPENVYRELKYVFNLKDKMSYKSWKSWHRRYLNSRSGGIGREYLNNIIQQNPEKLKITNPVDCKKLEELVENDIFWDRVVSIEEIKHEGYVYDLSVEGNENFICNNILAHNTREIKLPDFLHWVPMVTREPNQEGMGQITMLDLLVNSLRQRPDRIILGEIRRSREAEVLFEAMHTGHSVYGTIHADTAMQTYKRLVTPPISVPETLIEAIDLFVVMFRDRRKGIRRVFEVAEIPYSTQKSIEKTNILYKWEPSSDEIFQNRESKKAVGKLKMVTGLSEEEVQEELENRKKVLNYMVKKNINDVNSVGKFISSYVKDPKSVLKKIK